MWNKIVVFLLGLIGLANIIIFLIIVPFATYDGEVTAYPKYRDALHVAMEIGRLDAISLLLTVLGILLAAMALTGFGYVQSRAESEAREVADKVAREVVGVYLNKLGENVGGLRDASSESAPIRADKVDITEVEQVGGSDGDA